MSSCCKASNKERRISFTSASMAMGAFPEKTKINHSIINATLLFESASECPTESDLQDSIEHVLTFDRFSGIPQGTIGKNNWIVSPLEPSSIDKSRFVRTVEINEDGSDEKLFDTISNHMQDSLKTYVDETGKSVEKPWWEFLIVRNNTNNGMSAVILRCEHTLGDGISLVELFKGLIKYSDGSEMKSILPESMQRNKDRAASSRQKMQGNAFTKTLKILKSFREVASLPASKFDDPVFFRKNIGDKMVYSGVRKCILFKTVPLDLVKQIKNAAQVSINDVLLCCLSQAIHDYCVHFKCSILSSDSVSKSKKVQFRALLPYALPRSQKENQDKTKCMRNKWVFISADMGLGKFSSVKERLEQIHQNMNALKSSPTPFVQWSVQETIPPRMPLNMARQTVYDSFVRHSVIFSNVPGPSKQCDFAGRKCVGVQMLFCNLIPQVGILSYDDKVFMNMVLDPKEFPESEKLLPIFYSKAIISLAQDCGVDIKDIPSDLEEHANMSLQ